MRVRILKSSAGVLDGVSLSRLIPGLIYDLKPITANYLISQRYAEQPPASERAAVIAPDNRPYASQLFGGVRVIMPRADKPPRAKRRKR
jgi:hypothetical protein